MSTETNRIKTIQIRVEEEATPSFCLAKWQHVTMYLQSGETHSCYHPKPHKIPLEELKDNPSIVLGYDTVHTLHMLNDLNRPQITKYTVTEA